MTVDLRADKVTTLGPTVWVRFLAHWALLFAATFLTLFLVIVVGLVPAASGSPLVAEYEELVWAINRPALFHRAMTLDAAVWITGAALLIALAALLAQRAPIRSTFIAACGIGQVLGVLGAFIRNQGISDLALRYIAATPDQQAGLLQSYLELQLVVNAAFDAGTLLRAIAWPLVASIMLATTGFPRWMGMGFVLLSIFAVVSSVGNLAGVSIPFALFLVDILVEIIFFSALGWAFRRRSSLNTASASQE